MNIEKLQKERIKKELDLKNKKAVLFFNRGENHSIIEVAFLDRYNELKYYKKMVLTNKLQSEIEKFKSNNKKISEIIEVSNEKLLTSVIEKARSQRVTTTIL